MNLRPRTRTAARRTPARATRRAGLAAALCAVLVAHCPPAARAGAAPALPDTALAPVGGTRAIPAATLRAEWRLAGPQPGASSLTPEAARQFLDLLVDRELLTLAAARERLAWSPADSAAYAAMRDRLVMRAALQQALAGARAIAVPGTDETTLGIAARDSLAARWNVAFDTVMVARMVAAWSALPRAVPGAPLAEQLKALNTLPAIDPADLGRAVARSDLGEVRASELLTSWTRLGPAYRPRIDDAAQVRDLVRNAFFERALRAEARRGDLERRPDIAAALAAERERIATAAYVAREVTARIAPDPAAWEREYRADPARGTEPLRARVLRLAAASRGEAQRLGITLRDGAAAESLTVRARRRGIEYVAELSAGDDSAVVARAAALGPGVVIGPDSLAGEWRVARVLAVLPARLRSFPEVRDEIAARWTAAESEKRARALCARLRRGWSVRVNEAALAKLDDLAAHP